MNEMEINLEKKMWYRISKVIYIFLFVVLILLSSAIAFIYKPYDEVDVTKTSITCDNGIKYHPKSESAIIFINGTLGYDEDIEVKKLCMQSSKQTDVPYVPSSAIPVDKNYSVQIVRKTIGGWWNVLIAFSISLVVTFVVMLLIKKVFLYIVIGNNRQN